MTDAPEVLTEIRGKAGIITLNRPKAMNALNHNMVGLMAKALKDYQDNDAVELVILQGAGERGLCAGGDIIALYNDARNDGVEGELSSAVALGSQLMAPTGSLPITLGWVCQKPALDSYPMWVVRTFCRMPRIT